MQGSDARGQVPHWRGSRWTFDSFASGVWSSEPLKHPWAVVCRVGCQWEAARALLSPYSLPHSSFWCFSAIFLSCHHLFSPTVIYFHSGFSFFPFPALSREALWPLLLGRAVGTETINKHWGKIKTRLTVCDTSPCTLPISIFSSGAFLTSYDLSNKHPLAQLWETASVQQLMSTLGMQHPKNQHSAYKEWLGNY